MNSTTLLVILAVVVVCVVAFMLSRSGKNKTAEKKVDPAEVSKYAQVAQDILKGISSKDNVVSASYCTTRLRFVVKNYDQVDEPGRKSGRRIRHHPSGEKRLSGHCRHEGQVHL